MSLELPRVPSPELALTDLPVDKTSLGNAVMVGLKEIWAHKFRSALTMLGIVLGVSSLVAMSAMVQGMENGQREAMLAIGGLEKVRMEAQRVPVEQRHLRDMARGMTLADIEALKAGVPDIEIIAPEMRLETDPTLQANGKYHRTFMTGGVMPEKVKIMEHEVEHGRMFNDIDASEARPVCIIGTGIFVLTAEASAVSTKMPVPMMHTGLASEASMSLNIRPCSTSCSMIFTFSGITPPVMKVRWYLPLAWRVGSVSRRISGAMISMSGTPAFRASMSASVMPRAMSRRWRCSTGTRWASIRTFSRPPMASIASRWPFSIPCTIALMATSDDTPSTMPSMVSALRNLCAQISLSPTITALPRLVLSTGRSVNASSGDGTRGNSRLMEQPPREPIRTRSRSSARGPALPAWHPPAGRSSRCGSRCASG